MHANHDVLKNGTDSSKVEENASMLSEAVGTLKQAVHTLQSIKESEINQVVRNFEVDFPEEGVDFYKVIRLYEVNLIKRALRMTKGNQTKAAKLLKIGTTTLNSIIKRRGINVVDV